MAVNKKAPKKNAPTHLNHMNSTSYDIKNPLTRLRTAAASSFFGEPAFYNDGESAKKTSSRSLLSKVTHEAFIKYNKKWLGEDMLVSESLYSMPTNKAIETTIDEALNYDVEKTLQLAVALRNEDNIRTTPQVILVRAANHPKAKGTNLIRKYAKEIVKRGDEPAVCIAYQLEVFGKKIPTSLKRALADILSSFDEYTLTKYRMQNKTVKTVDVVNLVHPKPTPQLTKLVKNGLSLKDQTWEAIISAGGTWEDAFKVMGHMALLRNVRNVLQSNPSNEFLDSYLKKLLSGVRNGKQLPFRYYTAYNELKKVGASAKVLDTIEQCLELSFESAPHFAGKSMSLSDNSGSAHGTFTSDLGSVTVANIANLTSVITAKLSDEGHVGVFGDGLKVSEIRKKTSIFDEVDKLNTEGHRIGHGTEHGIWLFWDNAIKNKEHWDNVFIYSDMQAGHGGLYGLHGSYKDYRWNDGRCIDVCKLISTYRSTVNSKVNVFLVQMAGYQDCLIPEFYHRTYILGGWSSNILNFAKKMIDIHN